MIGPEPYCGVSDAYIKTVVKSWETKEWKAYRRNKPGLRHSKKFIEFSKTKATHFLSLPRNELRKMIAVATGHGPMRHYLNKIGMEEDPTCRL